MECWSGTNAFLAVATYWGEAGEPLGDNDVVCREELV